MTDYCRNGHAYTPENTLYRGSAKVRVCRQCRLESQRRTRSRRALGLARERGNYAAGCKMPSERSISIADRNYENDLIVSNREHVIRLLAYGVRNGGLPNIAASECRRRLEDDYSIILPRRGRPPEWSPRESGIAIDLRNLGLSYGQIGNEIGRSPDAVAAKLRVMRGDAR